MRTVTRVLIAAALAFGLGCASTDWIDRTLVTVDVTGTWQSPTGWGELNLDQQGTKVTGSIRFQERGSFWAFEGGAIDGTIAGDMFRFREKRGNLECEMTVSGDEMNGLISSAKGRTQIFFRRVDRSSRPDAPRR